MTTESLTAPSASNPNPLSCSLCDIKETPIWRRDNNGSPLCNSCGLWWRAKEKEGQLLPQLVEDRLSKLTKKAGSDQQQEVRTAPLQQQKGPCSNCAATETCFWRRNEDGTWLCNACGVYYRMKGVARPVILNKRKKRTCIYPPKRRKSSPASSSPNSSPALLHSLSVSPVLSQSSCVSSLSQRSETENYALYSLATLLANSRKKVALEPLVIPRDSAHVSPHLPPGHGHGVHVYKPSTRLPSFSQFLRGIGVQNSV